jgi:plastocyanin
MRSAVLGALAVTLLAPATAVADETIYATTGTRYAAEEYTIDQGEPLHFRNEDLSGPSHDVASTANGSVRGSFLFASEIVGPGKTSFVEGSQYLTTGSYDFFCSIHPSMKGRLIVTSAGAPKPRPGRAPTAPGEEPPAADQTAPEPSLRFGALRAGAIRRSGRITVRAGADEAVRMKVTVRVGKARLVKRLKLATRGSRKVRLVVTRDARRAIVRGSRIHITVDVEDAAGNLGTARDSVKLK